MSKKHSREPRPPRRVRVRGVRNSPPDLKKLASALIALAEAQAETEAAAEHKRRRHDGGEPGSEAGLPTGDAA